MSAAKVNAAASAKRKERDIDKLKKAGYEVLLHQEKNTYEVAFNGPKETPYEGGCWRIIIYLPEEYPFKSPSVGFLNKVFHPNVDFLSGSVCLDVINQTWTPMYELINIFEIFLPQLLTYPNPVSPLNHEAAKLYSENPEKYGQKVKQCIQKYASSGALPAAQSNKQTQAQKKQQKMEEESDDDLEDCSSLSSMSGLQKHEQLNDY